MGQSKVQVYQDEGAEWRFRILAGNGETVAQGEGYTRETDAIRGAHAAAVAIEDALEVGAIEIIE